MLFIFLINLLMIIICVVVHYETLVRLSSILPTLHIHHRSKVLWAFIGLFCAHVIEVWVFAIAYYCCIAQGTLGNLTGEIQHHLFDYVYYSFVTYTSLGLGDIIPTGALSFMTGVEALIGLLLIAWSAAFMFYQMEKYWKN